MFHAAELFGQNVRFFRTEPCRSPTPTVSRPCLVRDATFLETDRREIALRRGPHNRLGFAYQVAFVRVLGRFPQQAPVEIDGEITATSPLAGIPAQAILAGLRVGSVIFAAGRGRGVRGAAGALPV